MGAIGYSTAIVHMDVVGLQRARFDTRSMHAYTAKRSREAKELIVREYIRQGGTLHRGPVRLHVTYFRKMPKSRPRKLTWEDDIFKPDADNVLKLVADALNGIAYMDDRYCVSKTVSKQPRIRRDDECLLITVTESAAMCLLFTS